MQRRKYGSDKTADSTPEIEKASESAPAQAKPLSAERVPLPVKPQIEPQAESALSVLLRQAQAAEAAQAEAQKAVEEYRRAQHAHLLQQQARLPLEDRLAQMTNLSPAKKDFIRQHPEILDRPDSGQLHFGALDSGAIEDSPEYFARLEEGLAADRPESRPQAAEQAAPRPQPQPRPASGPVVSAPVHRESISYSTGRPVEGSKITLTPAEREAAHFSMPGIPKAEAEKAYAQNMLRMRQMKANGLLQDGGNR
jgi:hypothetical protein